MKIYERIKILVLIVSLIFVVHIIYQLRSPQKNNLFLQLFSNDGDPSNEINSKVNNSNKSGNSVEWQSLKWCRTRVSSIEIPPVRCFQKGLKWIAEEGINKYELNFISVEKWLAKYCTLKIKKINSITTNNTNKEGNNNSNRPHLLIHVEFIDGSTLNIVQLNENMYQEKDSDTYFYSEELQLATKDFFHMVTL